MLRGAQAPPTAGMTTGSSATMVDAVNSRARTSNAASALDLSQTVAHRRLGRLLEAPIEARDYARAAGRADDAVRYLVPGQLQEPWRGGGGRPRRPHRARHSLSRIDRVRRALSDHRLENPVAAVADQPRRLREDPVRRPDR